MHITLLAPHCLGFIRAMKYVVSYCMCRSHLTLFESVKERDISSARQPAAMNSNPFGPAAIGIIHCAKLRIRNSNSKQYIGSNLALILMNWHYVVVVLVDTLNTTRTESHERKSICSFPPRRSLCYRCCICARSDAIINVYHCQAKGAALEHRCQSGYAVCTKAITY